MIEESKVLVVDDDKNILEILEDLLEEYEVILADSGEKALEKMDDSIACVIMDVKMPGMGGIEAARYLRDNYSKVPVIMHTAYPGELSETELVDLQCFAYIQKGGGGDIDYIRMKINDGVDRYNLQKENENYKVSLERMVEEKTKELKEAQAREQELDQKLRIQDLLNSSEDVGAQILHDYKNLTQPLGNTLDTTKRFLELVKSYIKGEDVDMTRFERIMGRLEEGVLNSLEAFRSIILGYDNFRQVYNPHEDGMNDINRDLEASINLVIDRNYQSYITIERDFSDIEASVSYDSRSFNKGVFMNLLKNARDAIIEADVEGKILVRSYNKDNKTFVEISDNGIGVPSDVDIFEKKITTKKSGTGLGLYTAKFIVEGVGGKIYLSKPDKDYKTKFVVEL